MVIPVTCPSVPMLLANMAYIFFGFAMCQFVNLKLIKCVKNIWLQRSQIKLTFESVDTDIWWLDS